MGDEMHLQLFLAYIHPPNDSNSKKISSLIKETETHVIIRSLFLIFLLLLGLLTGSGGGVGGGGSWGSGGESLGVG